MEDVSFFLVIIQFENSEYVGIFALSETML